MVQKRLMLITVNNMNMMTKEHKFKYFSLSQVLFWDDRIKYFPYLGKSVPVPYKKKSFKNSA